MKPYRVTAYCRVGFDGAKIGEFVVGNFRWYWQANLVSWIFHNILGYGCNTWKKNP